MSEQGMWRGRAGGGEMGREGGWRRRRANDSARGDPPCAASPPPSGPGRGPWPAGGAGQAMEYKHCMLLVQRAYTVTPNTSEQSAPAGGADQGSSWHWPSARPITPPPHRSPFPALPALARPPARMPPARAGPRTLQRPVTVPVAGRSP